MTHSQQTHPKDQSNQKPGCHCHPGNPAKADASANVMQKQSQRDNSDVLGSYTGTPADGDDPVQDQDDL